MVIDLPDGLRAGPMQATDAARWAALLEAVEDVDRRDENFDAEDCAEELADPDLDLERDTLLVLDGDDRAVAYMVARLRVGPPLGLRLVVDAAVHPRHRRRGIGTALTAAAHRRADELGAAVVTRLAESGADAIALAERAGMRPVRWWSELVRDLTVPVKPISPPAGITIAVLGRPYDAARWDEPLRLAHNSAFADHWGSAAIGPTGWAHQRTGARAFRPESSVVALTGDGFIAGYILSYEFPAATARSGTRDLYVGTVGTLPAHRGRGIAGALLASVLQGAADQGYATASLTVDAENPTGALGVYDRAGFRPHRRDVTYLRPAQSSSGGAKWARASTDGTV
ncbi:GNAT family N-acetyltransferase [Pseudonocardia sp. DSM 110487]|uniref:GNAT family N-acetyltransferase n=1 Tax=Pseudonocardia sp. DSM 110487 TaxID=2865833 RepID=UPI001C69BE61|nr:GNAT family N-acetyltransferase [Pseudonocardia sp. DSM 110487]QYN32804.1 GNAT family N-acetyltransferase [Pseudonocardia sp. DSM 110487]